MISNRRGRQIKLRTNIYRVNLNVPAATAWWKYSVRALLFLAVRGRAKQPNP